MEIRKRLAVLLLLVCLLFTLNMTSCKSGGPVPDREAKTLLVGDSLFSFWGKNCASDLAGAPNLVNIAVGGTNTVDWMKKQEKIKEVNPTTVLVCLGTNDIADLDRSGEETAKGGDEYEGSLQGVLEMIHETVPDAHIYCLTVNLCGDDLRWERRDRILACNDCMYRYCRRKKWVDLVDTEYAFYDDDNYEEKPNPVYFREDYLHFSRAGYQRLAQILRAAMKLKE